MSDLDISTALIKHIPEEQKHHIPVLARIIQDVIESSSSPEETLSKLDSLEELYPLVKALIGKQITTPTALISFGEQSSVGDVTISEVAGRDVVKINVSVSINQYQQVTEQVISSKPSHIVADHEKLHNMAVIEHRKRLQLLELQAARLGRKCPPHILNEIKEIRSEINTLLQK